MALSALWQSRTAPVVTALSLLVPTLAACGGSGGSGVRLVVTLREESGRSDVHAVALKFTLRCDPTGGDLPNRADLCTFIDDHPSVMLHRALPGCDDAVATPKVEVVGSDHGRGVSLVGEPICGPVALAYWAAVDAPHALPVAAVRLHCLESSFVPKVRNRLGPCLNAVPRGWRPIERHA